MTENDTRLTLSQINNCITGFIAITEEEFNKIFLAHYSHVRGDDDYIHNKWIMFHDHPFHFCHYWPKLASDILQLMSEKLESKTLVQSALVELNLEELNCLNSWGHLAGEEDGLGPKNEKLHGRLKGTANLLRKKAEAKGGITTVWTKGEPCEKYCLKCKQRMQYEGVLDGKHLWHCYKCTKTRRMKDKLGRKDYSPMKDPELGGIA